MNPKYTYIALLIIALLSYLALSKISHLNILDRIVFAIISAITLYIALFLASIYLSLITRGFKKRAARIQEKEALEKLLEIAHKSRDKELIREQEQLAKDFLAITDKPENKHKRKKRPFHEKTIYLLIPGCIYAFYTQDFIINPTIVESLGAITVLLTSYIVIRVITKKETVINPIIAGKKTSRPRKFFTAIVMVFSLFVGIWVNIAIGVPRLFTIVFGENTNEIAAVEKDDSHKSLRCKYFLKPKPEFYLTTAIAKHCITKKQYQTLSDQQIEAKMSLRKSILGHIIEDIQLPEQP
ncbi:MAG: hypothetical protein P1U52_03625 [Porticoccaceae bacterium]|nr:hypothetical protein [Porticoccaceae bacterium]